MIEQYRIVLRNCGVIDPDNLDDYIKQDGYQALGKVLTEMSPADVIDEIEGAGLRGRGGGGFPTGFKWKIAAQQENDTKYVVCNADEGDPGAFMDRSVIEGDPHSIVESMAIAGYAIGASMGYVYVRAEYPLAIERLNRAIGQAKEKGLLGDNIFGTDFSFDLEIKFGAGAFVCGEETSLIHSIEGYRGEPTTKPPFPAVEGLFGKPTIVNNVETFANVPAIILKGKDWFKSIGTETSPGTKVFALAGKIENTGLIEVPMGTTINQIINEIGGGVPGGKKAKAIQTGGPSGGCIPVEYFNTKIDYESLKELESMMGSGGMIVLDEDTCIVDTAKFYLDFTVEESCGKCTPCRIGNKRLLELLDKVTEGKADGTTLADIKTLSKVIKDTSLCGLGQTSPNPVLSTLKFFPDEYKEHIEEKKCSAFVCKELYQYIINDTCVGCTLCARKCPVNCITGEKKELHEIVQEDCIKCGKCFDVCKFNSVDLVPGGLNV